MGVIQYLIATLLHYANSSPPGSRTQFYSLKKRLLERYGEFVGDDIQHIVKECWGRYDGRYDESIPCGPNCRKCGGTGIYSQSWHVLKKYVWCGRQFHVWERQLYLKPELPVTITGRIEHRQYGRKPNEAALWLYLLCGEWKNFWHLLTCQRVCGWTWWPLLNVQKIAMEWRMFFGRRRCFCGRWYWTYGAGWQICGHCRRREHEHWRDGDDDVPF